MVASQSQTAREGNAPEHSPPAEKNSASGRREFAVNAQAEFIVAATIVSAGVIFICVQASDKTNCMFSVGEVPGLKSVASATAAPLSISLRAGA